jgi:hypothetical protein
MLQRAKSAAGQGRRERSYWPIRTRLRTPPGPPLQPVERAVPAGWWTSLARVKRTLPIVAVLAILAGCGGGGGGTPLSKAEFIQRGDAVCTKYRNKNQDLNKNAPAKNPTDPSATDAQVKASAPILRKLSDNVRGARGEFSHLNPPSDVKSDWQNTLDDLDQIASKLDDAAGAAEKLDRQKVVNLYADILRLNRRVSNFETDYGFKVCGTSG